MAIQMFNKQGDSLIVENREVNNHLKQGWTFQPPKKVEKPKSKPKVRKVEIEVQEQEPQEEPAEASRILFAEADAEVIKPNQKEN